MTTAGNKLKQGSERKRRCDAKKTDAGLVRISEWATPEHKMLVRLYLDELQTEAKDKERL